MVEKGKMQTSITTSRCMASSSQQLIKKGKKYGLKYKM